MHPLWGMQAKARLSSSPPQHGQVLPMEHFNTAENHITPREFISGDPLIQADLS